MGLLLFCVSESDCWCYRRVVMFERARRAHIAMSCHLIMTVVRELGCG